MASKLYKDRIIIVRTHYNEKTCDWGIEIELSRHVVPPDRFASKETAEQFGFQLAEKWVDARESAPSILQDASNR